MFEYEDLELGEHDYRQFIKGIRTVVMGRRTYDFLEKDASPWAYDEQRVFVVTSRPIATPKGQVEIRSNIDDLITELRGLSDGDVWMLGGGELQMAFIERGALDEIEIYVMPELIGVSAYRHQEGSALASGRGARPRLCSPPLRFRPRCLD